MDEVAAHEALGRVVAFLVEERAEYTGLAVPEDPEERWTLARSLMNMRMPRPVPDEVLDAQDAVLRSRIARAGVTDAATLPACGAEGRADACQGDGDGFGDGGGSRDGEAVGGDPQLALWRGDITTLAVDAIVNAANAKLLGCFIPGHHCIDNAIHTFAGMQLRLACADLMRQQGRDEPVGRAQVTPAFNLPSRFVVHTVGPMVPSGVPTPQQDEELASCYRSCLAAAADAGCSSIALCCISTGEFRFPRERAARIAVDTVRAWLAGDADKRIRQVVFNVFGPEDEAIYRKLLG